MDQRFKFDAGKRQWHLMLWPQLAQVVEILEFGAQKYAENSFRNIRPYRKRYFSAAIRHLIAWFCGERDDPETGKNHLAHVMCNVLFLLWGDDNPEEIAREPDSSGGGHATVGSEQERK